ncbi:MAG: CHAT domain-containing protein [bacterium]|nr:CHAT domain-containing protein [bacterium]
MSENYADLEIRILERREDGYPVDITLNNSQEFPQGYLNPEILPWVASYSPTKDGERLFARLFADDRLRQAWVEIRGQSSLRRIRLRIDAAAPELHTLPWELLRDAGPGLTPQTLAADASTPFSRYLAVQRRALNPMMTRPLKLLAALANPENLADYNLTALDLKAEREVLESALSASGLTEEQLEITFLDQPVTLSALEAKLRQGCHLLHFVGHGMFDTTQEQAVLFLADRHNQVDRVAGADVAEMLSRQGDILRFVFLASCQSATRSAIDLFRGLAPQLVLAGVPAVLAMQDLVSVDTAREFAGTFYRQLLRHGQVDVAGNEARSAVLTAKLPGASIPVLFMRLPDGALWQKIERDGQEETRMGTTQKEEKNQEKGVHISVGGNATFEGVAFGNQNQVATDVNVQGSFVQAGEGAQVTITNGNAAQQGMSRTEVLKLFEQLSNAVNDVAEVSRKAKITAKSEVDLALAEIEEPEGEEPDKETVAQHLKTAAETLKAAGATALQAATFGKLIAGAVTWLGANYQWLLQLL